MAAEHLVPEDGFVPASRSSEWYKNLERYGSCLRLYNLLVEKRELIHQLGPEGITVLHKGVQHGCVKLVRFILVDIFDGNGKCTCSVHGADNPCVLTREGLLRKACEYGNTAVNMAVVSGSPKMVLLLKWAIDVSQDRFLIEEESSRMGAMVSSFLGEEVVLFRFLGREAGPVEEEALRNTNDAVSHLEVPDVEDNAICKNIYGTNVSNMISEVYKVIAAKLNEGWGDDQDLMNFLKDRCKKNVDFEFVPVEQVFLHFLLSLPTQSRHNIVYNPFRKFDMFRKKFLKEVIVACNERDHEGGGSGTMLVTLFNILDPRGRTILHVAYLKDTVALKSVSKILRKMENTACATGEFPLSSETSTKCLNAKDGAGRTILHLACIHDDKFGLFLDRDEWMWGKLDGNVTLSPLCCSEFQALQHWCFPLYYPRVMRSCLPREGCKPIHLAVVFNSLQVFRKMLASKCGECHINANLDGRKICQPFQIAAFLGRAIMVEQFLKLQKKSKIIQDIGFGPKEKHCLPALHCAAISGQVEAIQTILKYPIYDLVCQDVYEGSALHLVLKMNNFKVELENFKILALFHLFPNSPQYKHMKDDFHKLDGVESVPRMFSDDEVICINLLLQNGVHLWTPHCDTKEPLMLDLMQIMKLENGGMTR